MQLGDSGAGVITDTFFEDSFPAWKADTVIPDWIPALDKPINELTIEKLYIEVRRSSARSSRAVRST